MKTFFIYILCITLPSLMLANSQPAIVGKIYNSLRMIGDEEYRNEVNGYLWYLCYSGWTY